MNHPQLTPFETALLHAVEEHHHLRNWFEESQPFTGRIREFEARIRSVATELEKRLNALQKQQDELRRLLVSG